MNKCDLKNGMIVEMEDGVVRMVIGNTLIGVATGGGAPLSWFSDNLQTQQYGYKINSVYSPTEHNCGGHLGGDFRLLFGHKNEVGSWKNYCKLLWENKPEWYEKPNIFPRLCWVWGTGKKKKTIACIVDRYNAESDCKFSSNTNGIWSNAEPVTVEELGCTTE